MKDNYDSNISQNNQVEIEIGKSIEDFHILKIINIDGDNFVAKVKSKLNKEIYFMKRMNKNQYVNLDKIKYIERKIFFLKLLKNDNIVKYITDFEENHYIYLITEFVDNGDLETMINSIKTNQFQLGEEKLIRIFLQCLKSLTFLHSNGIIFRSLKPDRILIDNENNIKITNFKYAAFYEKEKVKQKLGINNEDIYNKFKNQFEILNIGDYKAPEIKKGNYYLKEIDVYSLGIIFCKLAYKMNKLPENNKNYSKELYDFIAKMIENNPGNRFSARAAYNSLKNIYINKFSHNSGIISYLRCLYSFPNIQYLLNRISFLIKNENDEKYPVLKQFYNFINTIDEIKKLNLDNDFGKKTEEELNIKIYDFFEYLRERGFKDLNIRKEISPKNFSFLLFNLLQSEMEINKLNKEFTINEILQKSNININANVEEKQKKITIINYFNIINSVISENFSVITKREKKCQNCDKSFEAYKLNQFMLFKVKEMKKILKDKIDINKLLDIICEPSNNRQNCRFCNKETQISKRSNLFNLSKYLILLFDRGVNCKNKDFINFDNELVIEKKNIELMRGHIDKYIYKLYCAIIRKEINDESGYNKRTEKYIYYTRDLNENYFTRNDGKETYNLTELKSEGDVVALFYYIKDLDQTKKKQDTNAQNEPNKINVNPNQNLNQIPNNIINNPGIINNNPGQMNNNPGQMNNNPGQMNNNPGLINNNPGLMNNNPGLMNNNPGLMNNNPGIINNNPGLINNNPGLMNNNPAKFTNIKNMPNNNINNINKFNNNPIVNNNVLNNLNKSMNNNINNQNSSVNNNKVFNNNINLMNSLEINNNNNMNQNYEFNNLNNPQVLNNNFNFYPNNQIAQPFPPNNNNIQNNVNNSNFPINSSNNNFGNNAFQINDINNQNNAQNNANVFNMNHNNNVNFNNFNN